MARRRAPPALFQLLLCNSFDALAQDANGLDETEDHSGTGTNSPSALSGSTVDSCSNSTTLGCSAFAMVASGCGPRLGHDAETSTGECDDTCLLAGDESADAGITEQRRVAAERAQRYLDDATLTNKSAWSVLSLWRCRCSDQRKAVRPEGADHIESDTFGLARKRDVQGPSGLRVEKPR